jgi:HD-GYP domain-containing protein (c-di-GMP phosphodiesterase class II)
MKSQLLGIMYTVGNLQDRLANLHHRLLETIPDIDRIACAIYDPATDLLKTFINSTQKGTAITAYDYKLSDSESLYQLAKSGDVRVIYDIHHALKPTNKHSAWLIEQGYQSSFTVPIYDQAEFLGFVFFDSFKSDAFSPSVQRDLVLFSNLINMAISAEFAKLNSINASVLIAKEFSNMRDFETGAHIERVARNCRIIAKAVSEKYQLTDEFIEKLYLFAPLHDIGKIAIPDSILMKPGKLSKEEYAVMKTHVLKGVEMIEKILIDFKLTSMPDSSILLNIVACHHEFLDGTGYPIGLKGDDIPIEARITTVADILDALVSNRPYKANWSMASCMEELKNMAEQGKLDKYCVAAVEENLQEIMAVIEYYTDSADHNLSLEIA